jgi:hypothetical protein
MGNYTLTLRGEKHVHLLRDGKNKSSNINANSRRDVMKVAIG